MFRKHSRSAGFSLAEVLVALAIASVMAMVLTRFLIGTRSNAGKVGEALEMTTLSENLLARVPLGQSWTPGRTDGRSGIYTWRIDVAPIASRAVTRIKAKKEAKKGGGSDGKGQMLSTFTLDPSNLASQKTPPSHQQVDKRAIYRVAIVVFSPSGRRYATDTIRIGQPAAEEQ
jgi:prepilin-type N-terminal cleavage/methylation domain-containing protein